MRFYWLNVNVPGCATHVHDQLGLPETDWGGRSSVLAAARFDDGSRVLVFGRNSPSKGWYDCLHLLTEDNLQALYDSRRTAILYTHWTAHPSRHFSVEALRGLERLGEHYRTGRIWVAPTSRILTHDLVRTFMDYHVRVEDGVLVINIRHVKAPTGETFVPTVEDLEGISFRLGWEGEVCLRVADVRLDRTAYEVLEGDGYRVVRVALTPMPGADPPA